LRVHAAPNAAKRFVRGDAPREIYAWDEEDELHSAAMFFVQLKVVEHLLNFRKELDQVRCREKASST